MSAREPRGSAARDRIVRRMRVIMGAAAVAQTAGCSGTSEPSPVDSDGRVLSTGSTASTSSNASSSSGYMVVDPVPMPASRCAMDVVQQAHGKAHFERPTKDAPPGQWTLVTEADLIGATFTPGPVMSLNGGVPVEGTMTNENGKLVIRAPVSFSGNAYVTFFVDVLCGAEHGKLSIGVRWTDADLEPGKTVDVAITPWGS
jgi:hypothetical protein